ncbi:MAG: cell division protein ZapA [bacterium]|jgi:cell division protein ZapA
MGIAKVEIFGEKYTLRGEADVEHIQKVAQYVDGKFSEVAKSSPTLSPSKMAILTSLNIADELVRFEEEKTGVESFILAKIGELISLVEEEIKAIP